MESKLVLVDKYVLEEEIGAGNNSTVFRGYLIGTPKEKVAIKMINPQSLTQEDVSQESIISEAKILQNLDHPHIVKFLELNSNATLQVRGKASKRKFLYSVVQLAKKGVMLDYLTIGGGLPEPIARYYFHQLVSSLIYIHKMGYVHRDLKPDNLLVGSDYELLVADFGHATKHKGSKGDGFLELADVGTQCYNPPDVQQEKYRGMPVDSFMAGHLLFIFLTGLRAFNRADKEDYYYKHFVEFNSAGFWKAQEDKQGVVLPLEAVELISSMLSFNPEKRPQFEEVLKSRWMKGPVATEAQVKSHMRKRYQTIVEGSLVEKDF